MLEVADESTHVWASKPRIVFFLSAMRHFAQQLRESSIEVEYVSLEAGLKDFGSGLLQTVEQIQPESVHCVEPGDWRVKQLIDTALASSGMTMQWCADTHFLDTPCAFREWAEGRRSIRLEYYYREMRRRHGILLESDGQPTGGSWNFDKDNRGTFGKEGPDMLKPEPCQFPPDAITRAVMEAVEEQFSDHPGSLDTFAWPVTREEALKALEQFIEERLPFFGDFQDAMWTREPFLYHSLLSASLNAKLLNPREVISAAETAYHAGKAPLNAVEGFIRQILGWREYVRGIYWWKMPDYLELNTFKAGEPLPSFYWDAETPLVCLRESIGQTLRHGYAHHIQRLMVTGLYGLLLGVDPRLMHEWYLAVYIDAVEWVELPNTLGMSQFADGGLMASKPYIATGKYIQRMSNYCGSCPARPELATGEKACPFTTLYWDYLFRNESELSGNQRIRLQLKNAERKGPEERRAIQARAERIRSNPSCSELLA
jgi:deoxyribodipyrimidine photolyase-related protein